MTIVPTRTMRLDCPGCGSGMSPYDHAGVGLDLCLSCHGLWFDVGELARVDDTPLDLAEAAPDVGSSPSCPRCPGRRLESKAVRGADAIALAQCGACRGVFLEAGQLRRIQGLRSRRRRQAQAVDARLLRQMDSRARQARRAREDFEVPFELAEASDAFVSFLGLPNEVSDPTERTPWATRGLMALIGLVWLWQLRTPEAEWISYAAVPGRILEGTHTWTALTATFLHGGWDHVIGNLYFFWLFGNNVEERLGSLAFLAWYLAWGLAASVVSVLMCTPEGLDAAHLGASGAISGVMGAYLVLCPRQRLEVPFVGFLGWQYVWRLPAAAYLVFWVAMQLLCAARELPGVGWWAHIGGFAAGAMVGLAYRMAAAEDGDARRSLAA